MAIIEGIRIRNYRVLREITLGRLSSTPDALPLTPLTAVIGKNGVGKSSLFDAFGFLADCLKLGVEEACDERGRGGFDRISSQGSPAPIMFEVSYRGELESHPIIYTLYIIKDETGRPEVLIESLHQQRGSQSYFFLILIDGKGVAWKGEALGQRIDEDLVEGFDISRLRSLLPAEEGAPSEGDETEYVALQDKQR